MSNTDNNIKKIDLPQNENGEHVVGDLHGSFDELLLASQKIIEPMVKQHKTISPELKDSSSCLESLYLPNVETLVKQDLTQPVLTGNHETMILKNISDLRQASFDTADKKDISLKNK
jgi:hypothetical protein